MALKGRFARVGEAISAIEADGALRCAPRELAIARSHLEFAELEERQGFPSRSARHLDIAEENVAAARVLSPPDRCADPAAHRAAPQPEPAR